MNQYTLKGRKEILAEGNTHKIKEHIEKMLSEHFGFGMPLQESDDEGYLEVYLHSDSYEVLTESELLALDLVGITDDPDSTANILNLLNVTII